MVAAPLAIAFPLQLRLYGRELENKECRPVLVEDGPLLEELIQHMIAFTLSHDGVGLAAPQVGIFIRLAVVVMEKNKAYALINPEITSFGGRDLIDEEACLSIPPIDTAIARVTRSELVTLESGTIERPNAREVTKHKGLEARIIQHEVDHLNGVFFINRVSHLQRDLVLKKYVKWRKSHGMEPF
jgi:peptide deformylase